MPPTRKHAELLTPGEVAQAFKVNPKTVTRWAIEGRFPEGSVTWTLGGHRRFNAGVVEELLAPESGHQS